jgi:hypothetical protein
MQFGVGVGWVVGGGGGVAGGAGGPPGPPSGACVMRCSYTVDHDRSEPS